MEPFEALRFQQTMIDITHQVLIAALAGACLWLCIKCHVSKDSWYALWVPWIVVGIEGLIMRVDTQVHRYGGFFLSQGDPWEIAKAAHTPTGYLMPYADILALVPLLVMLAYAYAQIWDHFWKRWVSVLYISGTAIAITVGVYGIVEAIRLAKTGF